jgi:hypothetical protein
MFIHLKCGCGQYNYNWQDWICHFKYNSFKIGLKNLLKTRIHLYKDF